MSNFVAVMIGALVGELLLLLLVLLLVAWFRNRARRRRDDKAIRVLVARVKNARSERETQIGRFLDEKMGMAGDTLENARTAIQRAELVLLQRFAGVYRKRDAGAAALFDIDLVAALAPYYELSGSCEVLAAEQAAAVDPSELESLRAENQRLADELRVTMETMSRMLNEYSSMFAGGSSQGAAAPIAALIGAGAAADEHAGSATEAGQEAPIADAIDDIELDVEVAVAEGDEEDVETAVEVVAEATSDVDVAAAAGTDGVTEGQDVGGGPDADQDDIDALLSAEGHDDLVNAPGEETPVAESDTGDDPDAPAGLFEEGAAEVVALVESDDFDVELALPEEALLDEPADGAEDTDIGDADHLFDAVDEPRKTQSGP